MCIQASVLKSHVVIMSPYVYPGLCVNYIKAILWMVIVMVLCDTSLCTEKPYIMMTVATSVPGLITTIVLFA